MQIDVYKRQDLLTVVGELYGIAEGEEVKLSGYFTSHPQYGHQFKALTCERNLPATANAILKYLSSGALKGVGPVIARRLVERFGDDTLLSLIHIFCWQDGFIEK